VDQLPPGKGRCNFDSVLKYTIELEYFYVVVVHGLQPKTSPEDYLEDLEIFRMLIDAIAGRICSLSKLPERVSSREVEQPILIGTD
jgi:hypothetical protein